MRSFNLIRVAAAAAVIAPLISVLSPFSEACAQTTAAAVQVAGTAVDYLTTAIVHSEELTQTGKILKSTETVELDGDLKGRVLYHVTSVFDFVAGTLVNTGEQVFSGTVAGSAPVMIHDDQFRFDVNLISGEEAGKVYLVNHIDGPKVRCELDVIGTGFTAEGNPTSKYSGHCWFRGGE